MSSPSKRNIASPGVTPAAEPEARVSAAPIALGLRREVESLRTLLHDLRNPVGAIALAVDMLNGPLGGIKDKLDKNTALSLHRTLEALQAATDQVVHLVRHEDIKARISLDAAVESGSGQGDEANKVANEAPKIVAAMASDPAVSAPVSPGSCNTVMMDLLRRLEILTVTRSALPALIAVQCQEDIRVAVNGPELLRALSNLVENAIEASSLFEPQGGPWTVNVHCQLDEAGGCVIAVRNRGNPPPSAVLAWLEESQSNPCPPSQKNDGRLHGVGLASVKRVMDGCEGRLECRTHRGETEFCLKIPPHWVQAKLASAA